MIKRLTILCLFAIAIAGLFSQQTDFPRLSGPYLGQKPPGMIPEIFAPDIVSSTAALEYGMAFTPDGREFYFNRSGTGVMVCSLTDTGWTAPVKAPFMEKYKGGAVHVMYDGKRLLLNRYPEAHGLKEGEPGGIWSLQKNDADWGNPIFLIKDGMRATSTLDGTIYTTDIAGRKEGKDEGIIARYVYSDSGYRRAANPDGGVNSENSEAHPFIAPDESYVIFDATRPEGKGKGDLYICFRLADGSWSQAINSTILNTEESDWCPTVSPDGKYLFFTRNGTGKGDIYWVSAKIIEEFSPWGNMALIKGGSFYMGDVFAEGKDNELPVHKVTLSDFFIAKYETSVGEFKRFVNETGYITSAEAPFDAEAYKKAVEKFSSGKLSKEEATRLKKEMLVMGGTGYWHADKCQWTGYEPYINWKNPGFAQSDSEPVLAISFDDAIRYCNWLSGKEGLAVAYAVGTGELLDENGKKTKDITKVRGYRLPTEAEWEYAAREGGSKNRFGNGKQLAKSSEINFRANVGDYHYLEIGEYKKKTTPVGSFAPNSLGLYDMSGNAWEWTGDVFATYSTDNQTNPCETFGNGHALRGGRWGGDAFEIRVFSRSSWVRNDRCNNSGFRIARSKGIKN